MAPLFFDRASRRESRAKGHYFRRVPGVLHARYPRTSAHCPLHTGIIPFRHCRADSARSVGMWPLDPPSHRFQVGRRTRAELGFISFLKKAVHEAAGGHASGSEGAIQQAAPSPRRIDDYQALVMGNAIKPRGVVSIRSGKATTVLGRKPRAGVPRDPMMPCGLRVPSSGRRSGRARTASRTWDRNSLKSGSPLPKFRLQNT